MEENMRRAQKRDAINSEEFFFRKSLVPEDEEEDGPSNPTTQQTRSHEHEYTLMTVDTIINGKVSCVWVLYGSVPVCVVCRILLITANIVHV